jgi:hypothetical protein
MTTINITQPQPAFAVKGLKACLWFLVALSLVTGGTVYLGGGTTLPSVGSVPPTVDSELRFYAPYWIAYGALCFWVSRDLGARLEWVLPIAVVLFFSGLGRALSLLLVGPPATMFLAIMAFEIVFPLLLLALKARVSRR